MNNRYKIIKNNKEIDGLIYTVYGIACYDNDNITTEFKDISFNINEIQSLCDYMNNNDIQPVHFYDIIEDFLAK